MRIIPTALPEILLLEPTVHGDTRGYFFESHNQREFDAAVGYPVRFVQDNQSYSTRNVVRGLHYQLPPHAQGKLIRILAGTVFDVAVDMRQHSPHYGRWIGETLSHENKRQLWIPPGFAHGFAVLSDDAEFFYKVTDFWSQECERALRWDDPTLDIRWPLTGPAEVSARDAHTPLFAQAEPYSL